MASHPGGVARPATALLGKWLRRLPSDLRLTEEPMGQIGGNRESRGLKIIHKVTRNHRIFPSDEAIFKVVYLAVRNLSKKWTMPIHDWKPALNRFAVEFAERFPQ